jgi:transposase-like protein
MAKRKAGNPEDLKARDVRELYDPGVVIEAILQARGNISAAAKSLGCGRKTLYGYLKRYEEVREAHDESCERELDNAESKLHQFVDGAIPGCDAKDQLSAIKYLLSNKGKKRGYAQRFEVTGADGGPVISVIDFRPEREIVEDDDAGD